MVTIGTSFGKGKSCFSNEIADGTRENPGSQTTFEYLPRIVQDGGIAGRCPGREASIYVSTAVIGVPKSRSSRFLPGKCSERGSTPS